METHWHILALFLHHYQDTCNWSVTERCYTSGWTFDLILWAIVTVSHMHGNVSYKIVSAIKVNFWSFFFMSTDRLSVRIYLLFVLDLNVARFYVWREWHGYYYYLVSQQCQLLHQILRKWKKKKELVCDELLIHSNCTQQCASEEVVCEILCNQDTVKIKYSKISQRNHLSDGEK